MLASRSLTLHALLSFTVAVAATLAAVALAPPAYAANSDVKINEFSSNNPDFIELINTGADPIDLTGWVLKDSTDNNAFTFPSTTIAAGEILGISGEGVQFVFGLGGGDAVRVFDSAAALIDSYTYPAHPPAGKSYSRCEQDGGTFAFVTTGNATKGAVNDCPAAEPPGPADIVVNEVESNGDQVADWVELKNRTSGAVDISGWKVVDGDAAHAATPVVVPANTSIAAGGYYAIYTEIGQTPGFGLGTGDSVNLYLPDGSTLVDTTTWGPHPATTWGRCPDGTGAFRETTASTRGIANACSPIRINEVESSGGTPGDWIELTNISGSSVDISGLVIKDSDDAHAYPIPASTSLASKGYYVIDESLLGFGLGSADSVRLFETDGTTGIESYAWSAHAVQSYGRCKDGVGNFADTKAVTKGAANSCPGLETSAWPGGQTVTTADLTDTLTADLSGLAFDPADPEVLWGSQNKKGTLFRLVRAGANFVPDAGWPKDPLYPGGSGAPDTEGITIGPDGFVYLASERDNSASGVSRMSILRYDPDATGATITATNEWDLTSTIPAAGANLGLEGVAFVPDSYLTANGFVDTSTGQPYAPSSYPNHGTGLYFVAVENTGDLHAFALDSDGTTSHLVATIDSGFPQLADVSFDPERGRVWAVTDDTHDGKTAQLKVSGGAFVVDTAYDRPAGMPNLNNEGLALAPQSECVSGKKQVVWSDDGDTDGHSLRAGTINCTEIPELTTTVPSITGTAAVGNTLTATVEPWGPQPVALAYQWFADEAAIESATATTLTLTPALLGKVITVKVTGTKDGYPDRTTTSSATTAVGLGTLATKVPKITGTAQVGRTLTMSVDAWAPVPVALTRRWYANGVAIAGATGTKFLVQPAQFGKVITVRVTGTKTGYATATTTSAATARVAPGVLTTSTPVLIGRPKVGSVLTVARGTWSPAPITFRYRWLANGTLISGATSTSFRLTKAQAGKKILVQVIGSKPGYATAARFTARTAAVAR